MQSGCTQNEGILPGNLNYTPNSIELKFGDSGESVLPTIEGATPYTYSIANDDVVGHFVSINSVNGQLSIDGSMTEVGEYSINIDVQNEVGKTSFESTYLIIVKQLSVQEQLLFDLELIDSWLAENAIEDVLYHSTNIRYTINNKGTGIRAKVGDVLKVSYEGRFLDGEVIDSNESFDFVLSAGSVILGWFYMVQEMQEGDEFTIYLPSHFGYGTRGSSSILPNSVLVFDITLIQVGN